MSFIPLKRKHTKKPNYPILGDHRKLFSCKPVALYMHGANGSDLYNLVTGNKVGSTGHTKSVGANGVEIDTNNAAGITDNVPMNGDFSAFTFVRYNNNTQDHTMINWGFQDPILWADTLTNELRPTLYGNPALHGVAGSLSNTQSGYRGTGYHCWGACASTGSVTNSLFLNGEIAATGGAGVWSADSTMEIFSNAGGGSGKSADARVVWTIVFDKRIPNREALFLTKNPEAIYQILQPATQYLPTFADVVAASTVGYIPIKRKHFAPPVGRVEVDPSSPQAEGLIGCWPITNGSMFSATKDISASKQIPATIEDNLSPSVTRLGHSVKGASGVAPSMYWSGSDANFFRIQSGTYSMWIAPTVANFGTLPQEVFGADSRLILGIAINGSALATSELGVMWYSGGTFKTLTTGVTSWAVGEWNHIAVTIDEGVSQKLYLNGEMVDSLTDANSIVYSAARTGGMMAAQWSAGKYGADAYGKEFRIYNRPLSAKEVKDLYNPETRWSLYQPRTQYLPTFADVVAASTVGYMPIKRKHTRKPSYDVEVDWANPMTKGLVACVMLGGGRQAFDIVQNVAWTPDAGYTNSVNTLDGRTLENTSSTDIGIYAPANAAYRIAQGSVLLSHIPSEKTNWRSWFALDNTTYAKSIFIQGLTNGVIEEFVQGTSTSTATNTYFANKRTNLVATYDGSRQRLAVNGKAVIDSARAVALTYSGYPVIGYVDNLSGRALKGEMGVFMIWDTPLSEAQEKSLSLNPYQILQPRTQYIPVGAAAASGFKPYWALTASRASMIGAR